MMVQSFWARMLATKPLHLGDVAHLVSNLHPHWHLQVGAMMFVLLEHSRMVSSSFFSLLGLFVTHLLMAF